MTDVEKGDATPVAVAAIPVAASGTASDIPMIDQEKIGGKCCGCFCDYRRAVVAISIIYIVWYIVAIILSAAGAGGLAIASNVASNNPDYTISDSDQGDLDATQDNLVIYSIIYAVFVFVNIFTLIGALRYSVCMLSTVILLILIQFGFAIYESVDTAVTAGELVGEIVGSIIGYGLFMYPSVGLVLEIKNGIMSKETYPREAYSCCCNPKKQFE